MKKVNIILSTYNGEKYLQEQLESLVNQTYKNIDIYIRDDGSSDRTVDILRQYEQNATNGIRIILLQDELGNLGYVRSFLRTIRLSGPADYYAFCDQDDYWFPDKIERAVIALDARDMTECLLYSSSYQVCDETLNVLGDGHVPTAFNELSVGKALSLYDGGWLLGFTCVINAELKQKAFDNYIEEMYSHDIWVQAVAVGFAGTLLLDDKVTVSFRRHEKTTSVAEQKAMQSSISSWKYRWEETFGKGNLFKRLKGGMASFSAQYRNEMIKEEDIRFCELFCDDANMRTRRLKKLFYPYRLKKSFVVECAWRFAILLGKI